VKKFCSTVAEHSPNFQRLQVYADIFSQLIECSPTFHFVLQKIKVSVVHIGHVVYCCLHSGRLSL